MRIGSRTYLPPTTLRFLVALLALGLAAVARLMWIPQPQNSTWGTGVLLLACSIAALAAGAPGRPQLQSTLPAVSATNTRRRLLLAVLGAALAAAGVALFAWATWALFSRWQANFDWAAPAMLLGVALTSLGLAILDRPWRTPLTAQPVSGLEVLGVTALLAFALFLRFYRIDYFPPLDGFVAIEEPQSGEGAWQILHGARPWEFLVDRWMPVPLFKWWEVSILALRVPFVLVSWLTLGATYLLLRQMVSWPAALIGTFLLAVSHWHLHYARLAHNIFPTTLLSVVVWALCARQALTGGVRLYPWIGFWSGYALYAYAGYRGIPLLVAVFLAGQLACLSVTKRRSFAARRAFWLHVAGIALVAVFVAGPVLVLVNQLRTNPSYFLEAFYRSYANKEYYAPDWPTWLTRRWERLVQTARIFHHFGDTEQAYNLPGEPMLDGVSGVLFTAGLFYCLLHPLRRFQGFFAFAFLFLLLAGALLTQTLVVARLQIVVPLAFVLIAFFLDQLHYLAQQAGTAWLRSIWTTTGIAAAGAALVLNWKVYFGQIIHSPVMRAVYRNYYTTAITYLHSLPDRSFLVALSDMRNLFMPSDYAWWRGTRVPGEVTTDIYPLLAGAAGPWGDRDVYLLIQRPFEQQEIADLVRAFWPGAQCHWIRHPEGYPHLDQIGCRLGGLASPQPLRSSLRARYFREPTAEPVLERDEPAISWALSPEVCSFWASPEAPRCRVEWNGTFSLSGDGAQQIAVEARNARVEGTIDDRAFVLDRTVPIEGYVLGGDMTAVRLEIPPGEHRIHLRAEATRSGDLGVRVRVREKGQAWRLVWFFPPPEAKVERPHVADPARSAASADRQ